MNTAFVENAALRRNSDWHNFPANRTILSFAQDGAGFDRTFRFSQD
jgi:hypothetical protein